METRAPPALEVDGLRVEFPSRRGSHVAVDGISFQIAAGEVLGLVGESGAGKSVVGASVAGLLPATGRVARGTIRVGGRRVDDLAEAELQKVRGREVGMVFQDPLASLDPLFTVGDQLVETLRTHLPMSAAEARGRALRWLEEVGIVPAVERFCQYPHQLSGGMRQRAVLALALCAEPGLVIADEPTTALDVSLQAQVVALLRRLSQDYRAAVLLISHDMGVVAELSDRVAVLYAGRIVEIGPTGELVRRPQHPYTRALMACIPRVGRQGGRLAQIEGAMAALDDRQPGCPFHPRCAEAVEGCASERPALRLHGSRGAACHLQDGQGAGGDA